MNSVGLLLISHSRQLVVGLKELLEQVQPGVPIAIAGGMEGEIGTNALEIKEALEALDSVKGIVILFDLGSALINAQLVVDMLDRQEHIYFADAPLVEGAYAAVVEAGIGSTAEEVVAAAESAKQLQKIAD